MKSKKGGRTLRNNNNINIDSDQNNDNPLAVPVPKILLAKKKQTSQEKKLRGMKWGMGLEHETQYFYVPFSYTNWKINDAVIVDTLEPVTELLNNYNLEEIDRNLLLKIDYEKTGRKCQGIWVLEKTPVTMPEFITEDPFSTTENPKTIYNYFKQLLEKEIRFVDLLEREENVKSFLEKNYFQIAQYPFGMCSTMRVRKNYEGSSTTLDKREYVDYCGSFHFTVTLPFLEKERYTEEDEKKFVDLHYNFGAMFQWIEPLLLAGYFSCDQQAMGTLEKRIKGSFRVARVGWGNFAGSDMRKKGVGVGRYADVWPYWREGFNFYESGKTVPCFQPNPKLKEHQAVSSFSSNIRTFGPNPENPRDRISGAPMKIPNGMEIRIFDHFETINLLSLLQIIILVAANSMTTTVKDFVYEDKDWQDATRKIMLEGWHSNVDPVYLRKLETILGINIQPKSYQAWDVLNAMVKALFHKNKDSDIVFLMYGKLMEPIIPKINKYSWDFAFLLKLASDDKIYSKYLKFLTYMIDNNTTESFKKGVVEIFGEEWKNNRKDILYFMEGKNMIKITGEKYTIDPYAISILSKRKNINDEITIQLLLEKNYAVPQNSKIEKYFSVEEIKKRYKDLVDSSNPIYRVLQRLNIN